MYGALEAAPATAAAHVEGEADMVAHFDVAHAPPTSTISPAPWLSTIGTGRADRR
jgi:hypothetical protein